ncbi:helix-turn-helix domain-containing protein [Mucilaginibacter ginsenosidivorax]|uniref:Helix-turn-helix transcriptional regulator n=1 Tax=Mucilaginibacter ginsenosidivorax TaxID=862126 RepID=A0A5B8W4V2_9SPHI|nr:AraC family transcriptional regulator [Mucilaginibacter ginsenosidivorax]QEC78701.1 helix-turn-helix transcriptional regulator [Mucilaginibacter ginsenosidivorax]
MPFELKNNIDSKVLFSGHYTTADYENKTANDTSMDGVFNIPLPSGNLKAQQWFVNGVRLMYSEYELNSYTEFEWKGDLELITMYFNLKGKFSLASPGAAKIIELGNNEHNLFYGKEAEGIIKVEELKMKSFMIQFTRDSFFNIARDGNDALKRFADNIVNGKLVALSETNLNIDIAIQSCLRAILECRYTESLKRIFYYSKAIELLVLQAGAFDNSKINHTRYLKSDYDKERILFARDYILDKLETPPTLMELARIAGINEFKLKKGFKEVFGTTVFGYLNEIKMELAKNDLLEKRKNATEIAFELGFSSVQHFSNAFKKKFGVSPNQAWKVA